MRRHERPGWLGKAAPGPQGAFFSTLGLENCHSQISGEQIDLSSGDRQLVERRAAD
jgi:hypothetical protein